MHLRTDKRACTKLTDNNSIYFVASPYTGTRRKWLPKLYTRNKTASFHSDRSEAFYFAWSTGIKRPPRTAQLAARKNYKWARTDRRSGWPVSQPILASSSTPPPRSALTKQNENSGVWPLRHDANLNSRFPKHCDIVISSSPNNINYWDIWKKLMNTPWYSGNRATDFAWTYRLHVEVETRNMDGVCYFEASVSIF